MREIGSEFWKADTWDIENTTTNTVYLLSGRTAIEFIICDIKENRCFKKVYMPSYCCESMLEPFVRHGIEIQYYSIGINSVRYDYGNDCDAVLLLDYFGYEIAENKPIAEYEHSRGRIVIYDATHKADGNKDVLPHCDYIFCSYRKWTYSNTAIAKKCCGELNLTEPYKVNELYEQLRDEAARNKAAYMNGADIEKKDYLYLYEQAENLLDKDYVGYSGVTCALNIDEIRSIRRQNARFLIEELKDIPQIKPWRDNVQLGDMPMFVPIVLENRYRTQLQAYLIKHCIYCPIHWPLSPLRKKQTIENNIYETELSLICDQRYDLEDIEREAAVIKKFFEEEYV